MNCLIVEDELPALELLQDNIRQVPFLHLSGSARTAAEAIGLLNEHSIDLLFLDIRLPGINGLEFLRTMHRPPLVILVTAYETHALDGFELDVVDYLLKPVPFTRFLKAVQKAHRLFSADLTQVKPQADDNDHVFVNAGYSLVKVILSDITFIEGMKDYVSINLTSGYVVVTRLGLKAVEERLDRNKFMRVHKSFIIALDKIDSIQKAQLIIKGKEIPIGEGYRPLLQNFINNKNF